MPELNDAYLKALVENAKIDAQSGHVADYIPLLSRHSAQEVSCAVCLKDGGEFSAGLVDKRYSIQSISKIVSLAYVLTELGEESVFSKVGKEPSGDAFNSIIRLETSHKKKPFNPLINAGAIVVSSLLPGKDSSDKINTLCEFLKIITQSSDISFDKEIAFSEKASAARNRSIAWFLKELKLIDGDVEEVLETYFNQCAITLNAVELARLGYFFAMDGKTQDGKQHICKGTARIVKSLMFTCGMYDGSGEFAVDSGIPAKSGVGGGIVASAKNTMGIGVFGPALDERGNSRAGLKIIKTLSNDFDLSVL